MNHLEKSNLLTKREYEILSILWESETSLVASEIVKRGDHLNINTVQAVLKKLIAKNYIEVADIVYSGTVLTRSYQAITTVENGQYLQSLNQLTNKSISSSNFVAAFLGKDENPEKMLKKIEEIETILKEKKRLFQVEAAEEKK